MNDIDYKCFCSTLKNRILIESKLISLEKFHKLCLVPDEVRRNLMNCLEEKHNSMLLTDHFGW